MEGRTRGRIREGKGEKLGRGIALWLLGG